VAKPDTILKIGPSTKIARVGYAFDERRDRLALLFVRRISDNVDHLAADNHAVGKPCYLARCIRPGNAEADCCRNISTPLDSLDKRLGRVADALSGAGDTGHADAVDEARGPLADLLEPLVRRRRRQELD
jgi:hypothetical protein